MKRVKGGYYLMARAIDKSPIAHSSPCIREIWSWLIRNANHEDSKDNGFIIKRGQLFRSIKEIQDALHWMIGYRKMVYSEEAIKSAMKQLRDTLMIHSMKQPRGMLITICNYDTYQNIKTYEATNEATNEATTKPLSINNTGIHKEKKEDNAPVVVLSDSDRASLLETIGENELRSKILALELYAAKFPTRFKKYASHKAVILSWCRKEGFVKPRKKEFFNAGT